MTSIAKRSDGKWRARYRDDVGKQHARHFNRKVDAQRWLDEVTAAVVTGQYVDPKAGRITFREYAEQWRQAQVHRPSSEAHIEGMLRRHAYPTFGDRQISTILPSEVQAWVRLLGHLRQEGQTEGAGAGDHLRHPQRGLRDHAGGGAGPKDHRQPVRGNPPARRRIASRSSHSRPNRLIYSVG